MNIDEMRNKLTFWNWSGINPYSDHPIKLLGLEDNARIEVAMINAVVRNRERMNIHSLESAQPDRLPANQAAELLRDPITRVCSELMRVPPIEISADDHRELMELAQRGLHAEVSYPVPKEINYDEHIVRELFIAYLKSESDKNPIQMPEIEMGMEPDIERPHQSGIVFRLRNRKEGDRNG